MTEDFIAEGGCMCGGIRLQAVSEPIYVGYCHCRDCRKASGAPVMVFAGFESERVEVSGAPAFYDSSPGIRRGFCPRCGTSISYEDEKLPGEIYLSIGVFDEPERFEPTVHSWSSRNLPWLRLRDDLPRSRRSSVPR